MEVQRFLKAAALIEKGRVVCTNKGVKYWSFEVNDDYSVLIGEKVSCTCKNKSMYGVNEDLPCSHIVACYAVMTGLFGPVLRQRWQDPYALARDAYQMLSTADRKRFEEEAYVL